MRGRSPVTALRAAAVTLCLVAACRYADATCQGDNCPEEHQAAKTAGLLGETLSASSGPNTCRGGRSYPRTGKLQPVKTSTPIVDLRWAGKGENEDQFVFALTRGEDGLVGGRLWRSDAYGKSNWDDRTNEMEDVMEGKPKELVGVINILFHDDQPGHMLFQGPGYHHWISEDFGKTYTAIETPGKTLGYGSQLKLHPTQPDWVLARVRRNECLKEESAVSKWCAFDLFMSQDFGRHWNNLTIASGGRVASFWDFDWGANVMQRTELGFRDETVLATVYENAAHMKGPYPGWDKDMQFVASHDFFKSEHHTMVPCGNQFEVLGNQIYLATPSDCPVNADGSKRRAKGGGGRSVSLLVSTDEALTFAEACIPIRFLDQGYNLVRTHDGTGAFVIVDHDEEDAIQAGAPISNIYAAGANATLYTLSLRRNYRRGFITDFSRVEGLPGVYLANQLDGKIFDQPGLMPTKQSYSDFVQTKVSFNGGAHWQDLQQPESFQYPECNACKQASTCQLHLHGPSSWHYGADARPSFYSHKAAPGIVMATGNTGDYLDFAADITCTWLSHDGGATWQDVLNFPGIYEFGDHGGIILMAPHQVTAPTELLYFSLNQGQCWYTVRLEEAIDVQNIRVEPKSQSDTFVVHGQACRKTDAHPSCTHDRPGQMPEGRIYVVDITDLMGSDLPKCQKPQDYDTWSPPLPQQCLLGRNITMQRRKPDAMCFNGYDFTADDTISPCNCTEADIECEFGFEWSGHDCMPVPHVEASQCPTLSSRAYKESYTHRRLIHEDQCINIKNVIPDTNGMGVPNDEKHGSSGVAKFFTLLLVLGVIVAAFGFWWSRFASDSAKEFIQEQVAYAWSTVYDFGTAVVDWVREKTSGLGSRRDAEAAYFEPLSGGDEFADAEHRGAPTFH